MGKYSETSKKYTSKYVKEKYKQFMVRVKPTDGLEADLIKSTADFMGLSVNAFIIEAIKEKLSRDQAGSDPGADLEGGEQTGDAIQAFEEVEPDEWDLAMIREAEKENDGSYITFEDLLKADGLTYADL